MKEGIPVNNYNPYDDIFKDERIIIESKDTFENFIIFKAYLKPKDLYKTFARFRRLNNAYLEGKNNRIKEIKKISYGCNSFYYFRNRLMYVINGDEPIGRVDISKIPRLKRK